MYGALEHKNTSQIWVYYAATISLCDPILKFPWLCLHSIPMTAVITSFRSFHSVQRWRVFSVMFIWDWTRIAPVWRIRISKLLISILIFQRSLRGLNGVGLLTRINFKCKIMWNYWDYVNVGIVQRLCGMKYFNMNRNIMRSGYFRTFI